MSMVLNFPKKGSNDLDLFNSYLEAKKIYECHMMTNTYGKSPEELLEMNKSSAQARERMYQLWAQCHSRKLI